jgi:NTP pyrophosphatase (non-canonical NTP hydrolase)
VKDQIAELTSRLAVFRDQRNWRQFHTPKNLAISVSLEASELLEIFQWGNGDEPVTPKLLDDVRNEAADVFLYLLMLCDRVGVDLIQAANDKIDRNESRFPVDNNYGNPTGVQNGEDI